MEKIIDYLEKYIHKELYFTEECCSLISLAQDMLARERKVVQKEKGISIPGMHLYVIDDAKIEAFSTIIDNDGYVCVNKGIIEEQKIYLQSLNWGIKSADEEKKYIKELIEYGWLFIVFHEYAHIFCGHNAARLVDSENKKAQEYEADLFSMDYLICRILAMNPIEKCEEELEKLFLAIYFLIENMQRERIEEWYNDRMLLNYYDEESKDKRRHPLSAQRMLYLFELLNITVITDKEWMLPIKDKILEKLKAIKGITNEQLFNISDIEYSIVEKSLKELKESLHDIRIKIPRYVQSKEKADVEE